MNKQKAEIDLLKSQAAKAKKEADILGPRSAIMSDIDKAYSSLKSSAKQRNKEAKKNIKKRTEKIDKQGTGKAKDYKIDSPLSRWLRSN